MKKWLAPGAAIFLEVAGTLALRAAIDNPWWGIVTACGYIGAFTLLAFLLRLGAPVGVVYGIWAAAGVALTAALAPLLFGEPFSLAIGVGIAIVIIGVVLVETGHSSSANSEQLEPVP